MTTTTNHLPMSVGSLMQRHVITLDETDTVRDAIDRMVENHVSSLPVVNTDGQPVGVVSITDLLKSVQGADPMFDDQLTSLEARYWLSDFIRGKFGDKEVTAMMSELPVTARYDDPVGEVAQLMLQHQVHHIPVVSENKKLVGMVSSIDFVRLAATPPQK
ncbi:MAG: CBS domain-containing protein [Planctomycetales bacterium]|nr:CBS domain-containing protein [Planctomycetales bacterium]